MYYLLLSQIGGIYNILNKNITGGEMNKMAVSLKEISQIIWSCIEYATPPHTHTHTYQHYAVSRAR